MFKKKLFRDIGSVQYVREISLIILKDLEKWIVSSVQLIV
jgi:hypothetical protein